MNKNRIQEESMALPFANFEEGSTVAIPMTQLLKQSNKKSLHDKPNQNEINSNYKNGKKLSILQQTVKNHPPNNLPSLKFSDNLGLNHQSLTNLPSQGYGGKYEGQQKTNIYIPGFLKHVKKVSGQNANYSLLGHSPNSSIQNKQFQSAKFQKSIQKSMISSPQHQGFSFTSLIENLPSAVGYFQVQQQTSPLVLNSPFSQSFQHQIQLTPIPKFPQINVKDEAEEEKIQKQNEEILNTHELNEIPIKSVVKEASHEIEKIISPKAYSQLKMKSLKSSSNHTSAIMPGVSTTSSNQQRYQSFSTSNHNQEEHHLLLCEVGDKQDSEVSRTVTSLNDFFKQQQKPTASFKSDQGLSFQIKSMKNHKHSKTAALSLQENSIMHDDSGSFYKFDKLKFHATEKIPEYSNIDQGESALLTSDKVNMIKEMNDKKRKDNFYASFIQKCLESSELGTITQKSLIKKKKEIFETDLDKIKVSSLLLDIVEKQTFVETESHDDHEIMAPYLMASQNHKRPALSEKQKDKLFQVLADTDKIVVHTSQNKDLMAPSERRDVVRLASWLEDIIEKIYRMKDLDFFEYFENMQLVCSACMSELIRQIGINVQERGQLVKRVWESMLNLMKQAFEQVTQEKKENEKMLKEEIRQTHKMYLKKLEEYIPQIENYKKLLEVKEQQNKRVVLEFRYLKKKDAKLEKYLKLSKKDLKTVEEEYQKLDKDYQNFKNTYDSQEQLYNQKIAQMRKYINAGLVTKETDEPDDQEVEVSKLYSDQGGHYKKYRQTASKVKKGFKEFTKNFDEYTQIEKDIQETHTHDVRNFQKDNDNVDDIEQMEDRLYSKKEDISKLLQLDDRVIEEIGGNDGITLVIGHCSTQTGPDLLKMTHQSVDTSSLTQLKDQGIQTLMDSMESKQVQTPEEWMKLSSNGEDNEGFKKKKELKFENLFNRGSIQEIYFDTEIAKKKELIDKEEQKKLDNMTQLQFMNEAKENEERKKLYELIKEYYEESPQSNKISIVDAWKNENQFSKIQLFSASAEQQTQKIESIIIMDDDSKSQVKQITPFQTYNTLTNIISPSNFKESITGILKNTIERDLDDLNVLIMSRTNHAKIIFEKILSNNLLKESAEITPSMIQKFIEDSSMIVIEEHSKLKKIWETSQKGMIGYAQQKLIIAEKDAELQEFKDDKIMIQHQIQQFQKEITLLEDKENEITSLNNSLIRLKSSDSQNSLLDFSDQEIIENEKEDCDELGDDHDLTAGNNHHENNPHRTELDIRKGRKSLSFNNNSKLKKKKVDSNKIQRKSMITPSNLSGIGGGQTNLQKDKPPSNPKNNSIKESGKKKDAVNPLCKISVSLIEAVISQTKPKAQPLQRQPSIMLDRDLNNQMQKRFQEIQKKGQFSQIVPHSQQLIGLSAKQDDLPNSSEIGMAQWLKRIPLRTWKNIEAIQSSPNDDSAAIFFNKISIRLMQKEISEMQNKEGKTVVMKQTSALKHIENIYQDKIQSLKDEEKKGITRTLNVVTYDYFLKQFGYKKLAETKLKQFLDSCTYFSYTFKIRMFTKLYGINKIMNYDFQDIDFYAKMYTFLEEGTPPSLISSGHTSLSRATEALFKTFENVILPSELIRLKQELDNMKVQDSVSKQKNQQIVDIDHALDILLQALIEEKKLFIQSIQYLFQNVDSYSEQAISLEEFLLLLRHIERDSFDMVAATKFYYIHCDMFDKINSQRVMGFQKFAFICTTTNMLSCSSQEKYSTNVEDFDKIKNIDLLYQYWEDKRDIIRLRFVQNGCYSLLYRQMIKKIDYFFSKSKEQGKVLEQNIIWITYRLLDDESKRIMIDSTLSYLIPEELNTIVVSTHTLLKRICSSTKQL